MISQIILRIDYCEARPFGSALLKLIYLIDSRYTKVNYISLNSQNKELSKFMSYMTIGKEVTK